MRKEQGHRAEQQVGLYLVRQSYIILAYNYRLFDGEIDIIAQHNKDLVFIEVKQRTASFFDMTELITPSKQRKIIKTARHFLATHPIYEDFNCRFDVALVEGVVPDITYIENAFQ